MGKKRMPSAEGWARMQARAKNDHNKAEQALFDEAKHERLYGKKAEEVTLFQQFTTGATASNDPRADLRERARQSANPLLAQAMEDEARESAAKKRRLMAEAARPRKLFVSGDARGNFEKLFATVEAQNKKVGPFDGMLCVGSFLPDAVGGESGAVAYLKGEKQAPLSCHFIDTGGVLLQAAPKGKTLNGNLHFLGAYGVREVCGLRVAFLSGHYDPAVYDNHDVDYVGGAFTARAVDELKRLVDDDREDEAAMPRGIDVLLTCGWPAGIDQEIEDAAQRPPEVANTQPWQQVAAPPLAELCISIEPRYHIFGSANIFYQRPAFKTPESGHPCKCIGLGQVGSTSKQQKWLHALQLSPMEYMNPEALTKMPPVVTPCPFSEEANFQASEAAAEAKLSKGSASLVDNSELLDKAISHLLTGDIAQYCEVAGKLQASPFVCAAGGSE